MEKIKVIYVAPGKVPEVKEIDSGLESLQHEVKGYIECVYPYEDPVGLIVNEEGKLNCMELNRALRDDTGEIYDIIAGPFLIAGLTDDSFCGLDDGQVEKYTKLFRIPETFIRIDGKIHVLPIDVPETEPEVNIDTKDLTKLFD